MNQPKVNLLRNELRHHGSKCIAVPLSGHHAAVFLPKRQKPSPSNNLASVKFESDVVYDLARLKVGAQRNPLLSLKSHITPLEKLLYYLSRKLRQNVGTLKSFRPIFL